MVAARLPTMLPTQLGARLGPFSTGNGRDPNYVLRGMDAILTTSTTSSSGKTSWLPMA
jgi:hypothetical protein